MKIHRNPEIYPNPEVYDPDNFLTEKCANRHYYAFIPFSAGPRSCVGKACNFKIMEKIFLKLFFRSQICNVEAEGVVVHNFKELPYCI